ncbi:hypothetical protein SEVIR_3G132450v4 [Setaria viridis]
MTSAKRRPAACRPDRRGPALALNWHARARIQPIHPQHVGARRDRSGHFPTRGGVNRRGSFWAPRDGDGSREGTRQGRGRCSVRACSPRAGELRRRMDAHHPRPREVCRASSYRPSVESSEEMDAHAPSWTWYSGGRRSDYCVPACRAWFLFCI